MKDFTQRITVITIGTGMVITANIAAIVMPAVPLPGKQKKQPLLLNAKTGGEQSGADEKNFSYKPPDMTAQKK